MASHFQNNTAADHNGDWLRFVKNGVYCKAIGFVLYERPAAIRALLKMASLFQNNPGAERIGFELQILPLSVIGFDLSARSSPTPPAPTYIQ